MSSTSIPFSWLALVLVWSTMLLTESPSVEARGPQSTTEFTIETDQTSGIWYDYGRFRASGAIGDRGQAYTFFDPEIGSAVLELDGNHGDMDLALWSDVNADTFFTVIAATGDYTGLIGITGTRTGYAEYQRKGDIKLYYTLTGSIANR